MMKQQTKCGVHGHDCHEGLFSRNLFAGQRIPLAGVAHQNGTIRFGTDPRTSALDVNCLARTRWTTSMWWTRASSFRPAGL